MGNSGPAKRNKRIALVALLALRAANVFAPRCSQDRFLADGSHALAFHFVLHLPDQVGVGGLVFGRDLAIKQRLHDAKSARLLRRRSLRLSYLLILPRPKQIKTVGGYLN